MLAPGALHVFTHLAEDLFLTLSSHLLPLPQPGFAVRPTEVSVMWVPPLTSVLPKASSAGRGELWGQHSSATLSVIASGEEGASQPEHRALLYGWKSGREVEPAEESNVCRSQHCFQEVMLLPGSGCPWGLHCVEWLIHWRGLAFSAACSANSNTGGLAHPGSVSL